MKFKVSTSMLRLILLAVLVVNTCHSQEMFENKITNTPETNTLLSADLESHEFESTPNLERLVALVKRKNSDLLVSGIEKDSPLESTEIEFTTDSIMDIKYQVELDITFQGQVSYEDCVFTITYANETQTECLESYKTTLKAPNALLKIHRKILSAPIIINHRLVITGCDKTTQLRRIAFKPNMPEIVHNGDTDCIYAIDAKEEPRSMFKLDVKSFPSLHHACHAHVQIANTNSVKDLVGNPQAFFDTLDTVKSFDSSVIVSERIVLIKTTNCYANSEPINIAVNRVVRSSDKYSSKPNGYITLDKNSRHYINLIEKSNSDFYFNIKNFWPLNEEIANYELMLYGVDDQRQFTWFRFGSNSAAIPFEPIVFKGFERVYMQYFRQKNEAIEFKLNVDIKPVDVILRKMSKPSGQFNSQLRELGSVAGKTFNFIIETPVGTQITLNLTRFNNNLSSHSNGHSALQLSRSKQGLCNTDDYVIVNLNKQTQRLTTLYNENTNPKICDSIQKPQVFQTFSNRLIMTVGFSKSWHLSGLAPFIEFEYTSEALCGSQSRELKNIVKYNSLLNKRQISGEECVRLVELPEHYRIIMYRMDWKLNEEGYLFDQTEQTNTMVNGKLACRGQDSLKITESLDDVRNLLDFPMKNNIYCMENPLNTFVTKANKLFMHYEAKSEMSAQPLVFELGYFGYKYLYNESLNSNISINFADIIPAHIVQKEFNYTANFEIRVQVPDVINQYFMPVLSDCNLGIKNGQITVKTSSGKEYPFSNRHCSAGSVIGEMNTDLTFRFKNVDMNELRSERVKFHVLSQAVPRVFTTNSGTFESNNFTFDYLSRRDDIMEYEWNINLTNDKFIQLNIDSLRNEQNIKELFIIDQAKNVTLYDKTSILSLTRKSFLIATSKLTIKFSHVKNIPRRAKTVTMLAYLKFSYVASPRVLQVGANGGELKIANINVKDALNWFLIAPKNYFVVLKIKEFESMGQLKLSLLNDNYNPSGIYHYDKKMSTLKHEFEQKTTVMISKDNSLNIEYLPTTTNNELDTFTLVYTIHRKALTSPAGVLKPFINEFTSPVIPTPKQTEQKWILRAPYEKNISVYYHFIDMLPEEKCSKSSLQFFDDKNRPLLSVCGHRNGELTSVNNLAAQRLIESKTNELALDFQTHDYNEIVYWTDEQLMPVLFRGYELFYMFNEDSGDCYFQRRWDLKCGYTTVSGSWAIDSPQMGMVSDTTKMEYKNIICFDCHLKAEIPLQDNLPQVIESPLVSKTKQYLKFTYKMTSNADLLIQLIYTQNEVRSQPILVRKEKSAKQWRHVTINLGKSEQDFRIQFILQKNHKISLITPQLLLDNIEFFVNNFHCESSEFPEVCVHGHMSPELPSTQSLPLLPSDRFGLCKKKLIGCDLGMCQNGAMCLNNGLNGYMCLCSTGFTGVNCERTMNVCEKNKCSKNSVECIEDKTDVKGYTCRCEANFYGDFCQHSYNPCKLAINPCNRLSGHGKCMDAATPEDPTKYTCECSALYSGDECQVKEKIECNTECKSIDKNAQCESIQGKTVCQCSSGFRGDFCEENTNDCVDMPCLNNGTCIDGINQFTCECTDEFSGMFCETPKICDSCNLNGTQYCDRTIPECVCLATHKGEFCEELVDPCLGKPCFNEGVCMASKLNATEFKCFCPLGFKGDRCEFELSECDRIECLNGATKICQASFDLETPCKCAENFQGKYCETYLTPCDTNPCNNDGICSNTPNGYQCSCFPGFSGQNCEISSLGNSCENNLCQNNGGCLGILDTYICICEPGYIGRYCEIQDNICDNNFCQNGICIPNKNNNDYSCQCHEGYEGWQCDKKINKCSDVDCNDGKCIDMFNSHECLCPLGTSGFNCLPTNYCSFQSTMCNVSNTLSCVKTDAGNKCNCQKGYGGDRCDDLLDACTYTENPCHNSGECVASGLDDYECVNCAEGFTGKRCGTIIDQCIEKDPCDNNGECLSMLNDYFCKCPEGFTGKNCSTKIEIECIKNKCKNNSTCIPNRVKFPDVTDNLGYTCECDNDSEGIYCEKQRDLCKGVSCDYGFCEKGVCKCDPRFPFCDKNQKCMNYTCENGATCIDVLEGDQTRAQCLCPPGFTGLNCELSVYCETMGDQLCGDKKHCQLFNGNYRCDCEFPFIGQGCSKHIDDFLPGYAMQLKTDRIKKLNEACQFGYSRQSQLFIGIIVILLMIFIMIGFITGHRLTVQYKKKFDTVSYGSQKGLENNIYTAENIYHGSEFKTPKSNNPNEITAGFSIPRPSVRSYV